MDELRPPDTEALGSYPSTATVMGASPAAADLINLTLGPLLRGNLSAWGAPWSNNESLPLSEHSVALQRLEYAVRRVYAPLIMAAGCLGNVLLVCAIRGTRLVKMPVMHFLLAIAVTDTLFIVALALQWCSSVTTALATRAGWCQTVSFLSSLSLFLSLWLHVVLLHERNTSLCHVSLRLGAHTCVVRPSLTCATTLRAKSVVLALFVLGVVVFVNVCLTVDYALIGARAVCLPQYHVYPLLHVLDRVDIVVNVLLPYTWMLLLVLWIAFCVARRWRGIGALGPIAGGTLAERRQWAARGRQELTLTVAVLVQCSLYLLLNTPSQLLRARYMTHAHSPAVTPPLELALHPLFHAAFLTSFALNLPVLAISFRPLRRAVYFLGWSLGNRVRGCCPGGGGGAVGKKEQQDGGGEGARGGGYEEGTASTRLQQTALT